MTFGRGACTLNPMATQAGRTSHQNSNIFKFVKAFNNLRQKPQLTYNNLKTPEDVIYFHEFDKLAEIDPQAESSIDNHSNTPVGQATTSSPSTPANQVAMATPSSAPANRNAPASPSTVASSSATSSGTTFRKTAAASKQAPKPLMYSITHKIKQLTQHTSNTEQLSPSSLDHLASKHDVEAALNQLNSDLWAELKKPRLHEAPSLDTELEVWIMGDPNNYKKDIHIKDSIPLIGDEQMNEEIEKLENPLDVQGHVKAQVSYMARTAEKEGDLNLNAPLENTKHLADHPELKARLNNYYKKWMAWKQQRERLEPVQNMYNRLFSISQKIKNDGDAYEVLLVVGLLSTQIISGTKKSQGTETHHYKPVYRHIVSSSCVVSIDNTKTGTIKIRPTEDGVKFHLEADSMFKQADLPSINSKVKQDLEHIENTFWGDNSLKTCLHSWINDWRSEAQFQDVLTPPRAATEQNENSSTPPILYYAPAIILRKRQHRSFDTFCDKVDSLCEMGQAPQTQAFRSLFSGQSSSSTHSGDGTPPLPPIQDNVEPYFPLPSNQEQRKIIDEHEKHPIIVVQGPPGTGKTHSIANVVSHLLASGKKILVTSEKDRALDVLKSKLPLEIQNLCVEILGRDSSAFAKQKQCIESINSEKHDYNAEAQKKQIQKHETRLQNLKTEKKQIQKHIKDAHAFELHRYTNRFRFYTGTAAHIADQVRQQKADYGWVEDFVPPQKKLAMSFSRPSPFTNEKAKGYTHQLRNFKNTRELLNEPADFVESLMAPQAFKAMCLENNKISRAIEANQSITKNSAPSTASTALNLPSEAFEANDFNTLHQLLETLNHCIVDIQRRGSEAKWAKTALNECLSGHNDRIWPERKAYIEKSLKKAETLFKQADIEGERIDVSSLPASPSTDEILSRLNDLIKKYGHKNELPFTANLMLLKYIKQMRVDGRVPRSLDSLKMLCTYFKAKKHKANITNYIREFASIKALRFTEFLRQCEDKIIEPITECVKAFEAMRKVDDVLNNYPHVQAPQPEPEAIQAAWREVDLQRQQQRLYENKSKFKSMCEQLQKHENKNPLAKKIKLDVEQKNTQGYEQNYKALFDLYKEHIEYRNIKTELEKINPRFVDAFWQSCSDPTWSARLLKTEQAWAWQQARGWLCYNNSQSLDDLEDKLLHAEEGIHKQIEALVKLKAWSHCLEHISSEQQTALKQWAEAVKKIGKGTGKGAHKHRGVAQQALKTCGAVIPAWVMPLSRVVENFDPTQHQFDVVIVDEASQTGPNGFLLHALAEKIIVIGDNEQISPDNVGLQINDVDSIKKMFLKGFKGYNSIGGDYSYYDWCHINFNSSITLREHFRCAPEIIEFSNKISYVDKKLLPMKTLCSKRLKPLRAVYVPEAEAVGKTYPENKIEAQAIVQALEKCIQDPRYKNKSFGIISLQGHRQVRVIEGELSRIDAQEREKRKIRVGDAYDFQGDERDVIFLSMVTDDHRRSLALTHPRYKKRYNVAASRAKEQMQLFYSVTPEGLPTHGFRYKLLNHCKTYVHPSKFNPQLINAIKDKESKTPNKAPHNAPEPFHSWFEARVFCQIAERGYRVIPQYKVGAYDIDLVIEGADAQLAVECDGDIYHAEEHEAYDDHRQSILERCGWRFWRCQSSVYYSDPDEALKPLWKKLNEMKIYPLHTDNNPPDTDNTSIPNDTSTPNDNTSIPNDTNSAGNTSNISSNDTGDAP